VNVLAQEAAGAVSTGEAVVFWILGPIALACAIGMIFVRSAVHSALLLVSTMFCLAIFYIVQSAPFLGFVQIIVYTGAVMMLFLFVLMLVGRDSSDSVVEVLRGQRVAAVLLGLAFALLLVAGVGRTMFQVPSAGLGVAASNGNLPGIGRLIFTDYLLPFELTSALLITAALGAIVLTFAQKKPKAKRGQRATVIARLRGEHARISPLPGPGVYATANSVAVPALLPDGSVARESLSEIIEGHEVDEHPRPAADAHALTDGRRAALEGAGTGAGTEAGAAGSRREEES
jgi:NADH-quinone oxidoreductase subunit J